MALLYQLPCNATAAAAIWRRPYLGLEINGVFQAFNGAPFTVTARLIR